MPQVGVMFVLSAAVVSRTRTDFPCQLAARDHSTLHKVPLGTSTSTKRDNCSATGPIISAGVITLIECETVRADLFAVAIREITARPPNGKRRQ